MRAPTKTEREQMYWMKESRWYTFDENGYPVFRKDTPKRVIDSYLMSHDKSTMRIEG
ncbi:MAG TPA: hypothetical protein IAC28_09060 [Candidatus Aphodovivens excrementavium]|nr:hypothetical protein [Candidatus Aphodovivens excrementavium]